MKEQLHITANRREPYSQMGSREIFALARQKMEHGKRFLDPYLTTELLAAEMDDHRNSLSRAVNRYDECLSVDQPLPRGGNGKTIGRSRRG